MINKIILFALFTLITIHNQMSDKKVLICEINGSNVIPLFIYVNGQFKNASVVFDESKQVDYRSSPLFEFKNFYAYSEYGDYIGNIKVDKITYQEVGCVRRIVGNFKYPWSDAVKPKFCMNRLIYAKKFYTDNKINKSDSTLVLDMGYGITRDFLLKNLPGHRIKNIEISRIEKFDIEVDNNPEIFPRISCTIEDQNGSEKNIISSFILSVSNKDIMYISTTCIGQDGELIAGKGEFVYFDFLADIDGDSIAEIITMVGYYESWDYKLLKKYGNKMKEVAVAPGGGC